MYLESLEIQGFKSFPDKIRLEFDKGITAVVGPNGSGKSNISDAVRWVLGEQSTKTLRGNRMEEVIFAGTTQRKSVGFASVTLNIANSKGTLKIPSEQVSVTRKLYRSGESEYIINGAQVRLKDIYELFMDTGLGRDGYAIIGQGRVSEIVSAKSNERREIFEEAAGISKYRYQKENAERELKQADEKLVRIRDILNELEERVGPLKEQSEKAAVFIEYAEKRKVLEITVWVKQIEGHKSKLSELSEQILLGTNEYNAVTADISRLEEDIDDIYEKIQGAVFNIETLHEQINESERSNTAVHAEIAVCENDISHCNEAISSIIRQQELSRNSSAKNQDIISQKLQAVKDCEAEIDKTVREYENTSSEFDKFLTEQNDFDNDNAGVNNSLNRLYIKQSELNTVIFSSESSIADFNEQIEFTRADGGNLRESINKYKSERLEISGKISLADEKINELNNRLNGISKLYAGRREKLDNAGKELNELSFHIRDREQRIKMLTDLENSMEGVSNPTRQVIKAGKIGQLSGVFGSVAGLLSVSSEYSTAVETALGASVQNVVVANDETAKNCIDFLKETKAGRTTFLPVTNIRGSRIKEAGLENCTGFIALAVDIVEYSPEYKDIFTNLLGRIIIAEDLNSANVIAKKYGFRYKICTLDGQVINAGGSFTGGSVSKASGILTRKNEIERLKNERAEAERRHYAVKQACAQLEAEAVKLSFDIEGVKDELNVVSTDKVHFEAEIRRTGDMLIQSEERLKSLDETFLRHSSRIEEIKNNVLESEKLLEACEKEISGMEALLSLNEEKRNALHLRREELSALLSSQKLRETELIKDREALKNEIAALTEQCEEIGGNAARLALQLSEQESIKLLREKAIAENKAKLTKAGGEVSEFRNKISDLQQKKRDMEQKSNELRIQVQDCIGAREKLSRETTRLEGRRESVQNAYDSIISEMSEQYNIYFSEAVTQALPVTDIAATQRELNDIRQKIRNLGTVNLAAIDEYKEVSKRYEMLSAQFNDALDAKSKLESLISQYTDNMRRQFAESFSLINENFKSVFTELFGGGSGELILTDPEDILESGIEIKAAPPGKIIKNISLMSGGEQAFIAVAIYFAILKINPAPFCILDEIEAALDEINVAKYARYLRNFTGMTQFILVTHRRGTMDEADVLYGVTMQEKGISKVLKLEQPPADN